MWNIPGMSSSVSRWRKSGAWQYVITVNMRAAGGGSHLTEEDLMECCRRTQWHGVLDVFLLHGISCCWIILMALVFQLLLLLLFSASRTAKSRESVHVCPGLAAKRSASTSRHYKLSDVMCISFYFFLEDSCRFYLIPGLGRYGEDHLSFLFRSFFEKLLSIWQTLRHVSYAFWLPIRCTSGSTSFRSPKMKTCKIPSPDPCGRPGNP